MAGAEVELEFATADGWGGAVDVGAVSAASEVSEFFLVAVDVFEAGFVEGQVCFAEGIEVGGPAFEGYAAIYFLVWGGRGVETGGSGGGEVVLWVGDVGCEVVRGSCRRLF